MRCYLKNDHGEASIVVYCVTPVLFDLDINSSIETLTQCILIVLLSFSCGFRLRGQGVHAQLIRLLRSASI